MWKHVKVAVAASLVLGLLLAIAGYAYIASLDLDGLPVADPASTPADVAFLRDAVRTPRGRVLAVVTSTAHFPGSQKRAGYELTELARAYYVFQANGYEVDIASPRGGRPPMVRDADEELVVADHAFLNDAGAQAKLADSLPLADIDPMRYAAVYFVGGKGTMFDFPGNPDIQRIVRDVYTAGGVIGAVCHGPAALLDVDIDGRPLLAGRRATGFTNEEELFLIPDARERFPYLLQDRMTARGAHFVQTHMYLDNTVVDGRLVTGQNPWSTWSTAEAMVRALGHAPVAREATGEEQAVRVLAAYHRNGAAAAMRERVDHPGADRRLLLMHAVVAGMQGRVSDAYRLQHLGRP